MNLQKGQVIRVLREPILPYFTFSFLRRGTKYEVMSASKDYVYFKDMESPYKDDPLYNLRHGELRQWEIEVIN